MLRPAATIARYTVLEALHNRLPWVMAALALAAAGMAGFLDELALTEGRALQAALLASGLRLAGVFIVATVVVTSIVRDTHDKGIELLLGLPIPRAAWLLGKLAGFGIVALLPAALFGALVALAAPAAGAALWALSFMLELWIVAAFSLLCVLSFSQVLPALAATASFYVLARAIGSLQLIGATQLAAPSFGQRTVGAVVDLIGALLPHLDRFARTEWLLYQAADAQQLLANLVQAAIYVSLLAAAALFDLYRKNI